MALQADLITRQLLKEELAHNARLGRLINKLERKLRRWRKKSARQHQILTAIKRLNREDMRRRGLDV